MKGYHCIMLNATAPSKTSEKELEIIDFSTVHPIEQSVGFVKEMLGNDVEMYAIAYSAGSNHLVRHLGTHEGCKDKCGFKAAVSVSGAFCLLTAGM